MIQILLVDDHPSVGEGTKSMIEQDVEMKVTVVTSSMEALEVLKSETFDVLMFDLNMPVINGLELTRRAIAINPDTPILIYTGYDISSHFNILVEARVSGFISKTASQEQLVNAIRCVLRGEAVVPISLLHQLRRNDVRAIVSANEVNLEGISIDEKEQTILQEVARGRSNREIADSLLMSQRMVEYNLTRIFGKLKVRSRSEAIFEAKRLGLIPNEDFMSY
ncbi:response regulator transcription factor [Desulfosporosinus youngiae]|uniref:Stage 0 sporulation protein A homolog n=1 Tax=Desulfosporosinus youngiae DSM 17734 TaxID=768710 RepID=H5Y5G8_9FIRM|nr:response regulator transcription factor [Desulfosporosinus youngiae]EHQ90418.1 response regulator containing a CheY-like receiver domain and an HTH DNA-binding domain [Desulfosporosinus youngiae DSM 17734]